MKKNFEQTEASYHENFTAAEAFGSWSGHLVLHGARALHLFSSLVLLMQVQQAGKAPKQEEAEVRS